MRKKETVVVCHPGKPIASFLTPILSVAKFQLETPPLGPPNAFQGAGYSAAGADQSLTARCHCGSRENFPPKVSHLLLRS
jgi:hypothetical protein